MGQAAVARNLEQWLEYQQRTHPRSIELGLARVGQVWQRMGSPRPAPVVITVGGTNGKGSTVAFLEAMLAADGKRVGAYTSPHLIRYNERVRIDGVDVDDARLIDAFARIEQARAGTALTYFEFGTLAALWIFAHTMLDVALLEVGLGGRLDAVNIVDADAAIVTTIDLDHQDWLGNDHDSIGREKAGIFRRERPAIIGMREPPCGLLTEAARIGAGILRAGIDFDTQCRANGWSWHRGTTSCELPPPRLAAECQIDNAAAAIAALHSLRDRLGWNPDALAAGMRSAHAAARLQRFAIDGGELVVDVAHNPQAARVLARSLRADATEGATLAVFGALDDKDVRGIVEPLAGMVDRWFLAGLDTLTPRGLSAGALAARVRAAVPEADIAGFDSPRTALAAARAGVAAGRVIAFGSFYVAGEVLSVMEANRGLT